MALKAESIEKIKAWIAKDGARSAGQKMIDQWLRSKIGLTSLDMPDTATFASGLDDVQELLEQEEFDEAFAVAKETAFAMLEDEGMDIFENTEKIKKIIQHRLLSLQESDIQNSSDIYIIHEKERLSMIEALSSGNEIIMNLIADDHPDKKRIIQIFNDSLSKLKKLKKVRGWV